MGPEVLIPLVCIIFALSIAGIAIGGHLVKTSYRQRKDNTPNTKKIIVGWILVAVCSLVLTVLTIYAIASSGGGILTVLILFSPLILIALFVFTLTFGISSLAASKTQSKEEGGGQRAKVNGIISLIGTLIVVVVVIALFAILLYQLSHMHIGAM